MRQCEWLWGWTPEAHKICAACAVKRLLCDVLQYYIVFKHITAVRQACLHRSCGLCSCMWQRRTQNNRATPKPSALVRYAELFVSLYIMHWQPHAASGCSRARLPAACHNERHDASIASASSSAASPPSVQLSIDTIRLSPLPFAACPHCGVRCGRPRGAHCRCVHRCPSDAARPARREGRAPACVDDAPGRPLHEGTCAGPCLLCPYCLIPGFCVLC